MISYHHGQHLPDPPPSKELFSHLITHEARLTHQAASLNSFEITANVTTKPNDSPYRGHRSSRNCGSSRSHSCGQGGSSSSYSSDERSYCQGKTRGIALEKACIAGKLSVHDPDGRMEDDFNLDYVRPKDRNTMMFTMNTAYRTHRNRMHQYYSLFPNKEEALEHPYLNMKKEDWAPIYELFSTEEFQLEHESERRSFTKVQIFKDVLGMKAGYVRGLGFSMQHIGASSSVSSNDLVRRLGEARVEIEEMRARQMEYEELLVRHTEME
ncbi:hypothetical protein CJ030_MR7G016903 [Morella rubra]|uniref:Uncharacterized protein n=1 Tax=Morella rubra TaxID=262757 RepID=A0A6A1UZW3_9ROSI|nr:hypothetical protein CJ030_MR7G016903 [Morella rubra]